MLVKINTDKNIEGHERLEQYFTDVLENALKNTTTELHVLKYT